MRNEEYKFNAIIEDIKDCVARNQPVLVGTVSVEKSEMLSQALDKAGIKHNVLNAKFHAQEAEIVAEAGAPGAVTIATNMAGRGTDIILGGNWKAKAAKLGEPNPEQIEALKAEWEKNHEIVMQAGGFTLSGQSVTNHAVLITSCVVVQVVKVTQVLPRFYPSLEDGLIAYLSE